MPRQHQPDLPGNCTIADLDAVPNLILCNESQTAGEVKATLGDEEYDSYFVLPGENEYIAVWGYAGFIPYTQLWAVRIL